MSNTLKYSLIGLGVVGLLIGAYFAYNHFSNSKKEEKEETKTLPIKEDE